jgi:hypothetical protein
LREQRPAVPAGVQEQSKGMVSSMASPKTHLSDSEVDSCRHQCDRLFFNEVENVHDPITGLDKAAGHGKIQRSSLCKYVGRILKLVEVVVKGKSMNDILITSLEKRKFESGDRL